LDDSWRLHGGKEKNERVSRERETKQTVELEDLPNARIVLAIELKGENVQGLEVLLGEGEPLNIASDKVPPDLISSKEIKHADVLEEGVHILVVLVLDSLDLLALLSSHLLLGLLGLLHLLGIALLELLRDLLKLLDHVPDILLLGNRAQLIRIKGLSLPLELFILLDPLLFC